jgi:hypothetical protein
VCPADSLRNPAAATPPTSGASPEKAGLSVVVDSPPVSWKKSGGVGVGVGVGEALAGLALVVVGVRGDAGRPR